jgi:hypothetical protein
VSSKTASKPASKPAAASKAPRKAAARPAHPEKDADARPAVKTSRAKVPFPRKNQAPSEAEFMARLPLATGKKFDGVRTFIKKQKGVTEDLYFYGPKTGWAFRYVRGPHSLATVMIHDDHLMGIVALDAAALATVDFDSLSDVGQRARRVAHGSPSLLWMDLPLDDSGAADFKSLLKAKLKTLPAGGPLPPPPPPARAGR